MDTGSKVKKSLSDWCKSIAQVRYIQQLRLKINHSFQVHFRISNTFESWSLWRGGWYLLSLLIRDKIKNHENEEGDSGGTPLRQRIAGARMEARGAASKQGGKGGREHPKPPRLPQTTEATTREDCTGEWKHLCSNFEIYLLKFWNIFVEIMKYICRHFEIHFVSKAAWSVNMKHKF